MWLNEVRRRFCKCVLPGARNVPDVSGISIRIDRENTQSAERESSEHRTTSIQGAFSILGRYHELELELQLARPWSCTGTGG